MKTIILIALLLFINAEINLSQEVIFVQKNKALSSYGYSNVTKNISGIRNGVSYNEYVGKKGKIIGERTNGFSDFYEIKLDSGETVFSTYNDDEYDIRKGKYHSMDDFYFVEDFEMANSWINKNVYLVNKYHWDIELMDYDDKDVFNGKIPVGNFEKVKVLKVVPKIFGEGKGISSFYVLVEKENGQKGYVQFEMLSEKNLISKFSKKIQNMVKERKIAVGMTSEQAILSWGKPDDIKRTIGSWGKHEQWIYGSNYLYFENGKLTSWQD
ncbi:MAG: hypothetical protein A2455_17145 [Ignavibacteria bacterium RIFOXYC2_FULL_35_16]|nr:MAG: hypothetical protein A2058_05875 [Ignavibacteria bacterium GWA2_36_19]OGU53268.1 MAG: hypothetical protein A2006_11690 [Ignavibacteria bacterium GWC2_35_8]OGU56419.1 MAG: hypothetical protein A2X60_15340 [Ignavibacteria bacterium GWF2_35_20]OGU90843.1 MAG: hypothetical protein A3K31_12465 [Ignavibacteria bacterium RIFOXYA12_FULL_35_25]OGU91518.1 MAG: hypothetical protein A2492_02695 [Ignavibacteria bacterium RIFOXYC12_FULL_35_11]OGU94501.1 MAG: hypothetical protein A2347_03070 [Ignavib